MQGLMRKQSYFFYQPQRRSERIATEVSVCAGAANLDLMAQRRFWDCP
jgi:hypothetical protein